MADSDPTWHPPQIPDVRHLRERGRARGQVQVSAPRTPQGHKAGHNLATQDRQRSSDPLRYETQSTPYWDDANGAIHNIPSALSRNSAPPHAQTMSGETREINYRELNTPIQVPPRAAFNNPYLDIVGDGPYGRNQAMYTAAGMAEVEYIGERTRRRDFTPYFDAADARNGMDLCSLDKEGFRHALAKKDMNQKLRQDTIETMKAATAKRGTGHTERMSEPRVPLRASNEIRHPTTPKFRSKFAIPASPKTPGAIAVPASRPVSYHWPDTLSPVLEAPSPLEISSDNQPNTLSKHERTSTLDRILNLRAEEQAKALARLQGELYKPSQTKVTKQQAPDALSHGKSGSESQRIAHFDRYENKQQAFEFIVSPVSPESQRWKYICTIPDVIAPAKIASAGSSVYSADDNTQEDEIDRRSKAVVGLQTFQNLPPLSSKKAEFQRNSAVPEGLDMGKIGACKEETNNGNELQQVPREKSLEEAQIGLLEYFNVPLEATGTDKADA
ncbi:hypothetical protein AA0113_g10749 [Alternaria arborescens]|uniref:Uncharacterized protein n=1 Tax=Alternaria arborescens TaxID=156630 RepID=A0A4Q4QN18_9PLEO|nr:hypothetical protein AA0113_g10749 [Alternaria arborescens]